MAECSLGKALPDIYEAAGEGSGAVRRKKSSTQGRLRIRSATPRRYNARKQRPLPVSHQPRGFRRSPIGSHAPRRFANHKAPTPPSVLRRVRTLRSPALLPIAASFRCAQCRPPSLPRPIAAAKRSGRPPDVDKDQSLCANFADRSWQVYPVDSPACRSERRESCALTGARHRTCF